MMMTVRRLAFLLSCLLLLTACAPGGAPEPTPAPEAEAWMHPDAQALKAELEERFDAFVQAQARAESAYRGAGTAAVEAELRQSWAAALTGPPEALPDNPVDAWFQSLDALPISGPDLGAVARVWADAWHREAEWAYAGLPYQRDYPRDAAAWEYVGAAQTAFEAFAEDWGAWCQLSASSAWDPENAGEPIHYGTSAVRLGHEGRRDAYRAMALRMGAMMGWEGYGFCSADCAGELNGLDGVDIPIFSNPIDGFFETADFLRGPTTLEGSWRAGLRANAWEEELDHIYDGLEADASPALTKWVVDVGQVRKDFRAFVAAQSEAEAYLNFTDAFGREDGSYGDTIGRGTGFGGGEAWYRMELVRAHVFDLYTMMSYPNYHLSDDFYFDPQKIVSQVEEAGLPFQPGVYAVDPQRMDQPRTGSDNPIDDYFEVHPLSDSGVTMVMTERSALELDIWQAELEHAYDQLIARAHPTDPAPKQALERAREAYLKFAPEYGALDAYYRFSGAFLEECRESDTWESLGRGTLAGPEQVGVTAALYHSQTLRLWEQIGRLGVEPGVQFDPAEWKERIEAVGE